jgi:hypothetical protein
VRQCNFVGGRVTRFAMVERVKEIGMFAQRARNCRQPPYMFRMLPPGIMQPAVAVGDECDAQRTGRRCRY